VAFIAGYHHTHATLAKKTLDRGGIAVVEKPLATTVGQLASLLDSLRAHPGKFFAGFHKRYSSLNRLALRDLGAKRGGPISYHCIIHEVELPAWHWYRWPNSCSRLVSNGCHWIDHFLFLNDFAAPVHYDAQESAAGEVSAFVELENGAFFTMALTDRGSSRIGVEDYIELRYADVTVRITNGSTYVAEDSRKRLRHAKVNRTASYADMYRTISERVVAGAPGDTIESVERSTSLVLALEDRLQSKRPRAAEKQRHIPTMVGSE
jgi:predicted dehydrogenase